MDRGLAVGTGFGYNRIPDAWEASMIEIIIERWDAASGLTELLWSVWRDGKRIEMGGPHDDPALGEAAARRFCSTVLGTEPDRVSRL